MTLKKAMETIRREEQKAAQFAEKRKQDKQAYQLGRASGLKSALSVLAHVDKDGLQGGEM